jgi:hypothetical protein
MHVLYATLGDKLHAPALHYYENSQILGMFSSEGCGKAKKNLILAKIMICYLQITKI